MTLVDGVLEGRECEVLLAGGTFYESPRWRSGSWYVSDLYNGVAWTIPDGGDPPGIVARLDDFVGGLGWRRDGALLAVSMTKRQIVAVGPSGEGILHSDLSALSDSRLNDMTTDSAGRAWVGNYGFDFMAGADPQPGCLFHVAADGTASVAATGVVFPNGAVLSKDERALVVGETFASRYTEFDIEPTGALLRPRSWATFGVTPALTTLAEMRDELQVIPDGCAIDSQGCLWVADVKGRRAIRVAKGGSILEEIRVSRGHCYACGLGGADGTSLVLCLAPGSAQAERERATDATVVRVRVAVPAFAS
jgi:sugar lactone lactonase YvrE